mgnify:CR=1 FL=1
MQFNYNLNNFTVISNDAGGAEILAAWLKKKKLSFKAILSGPAKSIFKEKKLRFIRTNIKNAIESSSFIITGTSWTSKIELKAIKLAKKKKKYVVSFLDHWINYKQRFKIKNKYIFKNKIWVGDQYAEKLAKKIFKTILIRKIKNPIWEEYKKKKFFILKNKKKKFFFFLKNLNDKNFKKKNIKMTDFEMIEKIILFLRKKFKNSFKNYEIFIKNHPSEKKNKYIKFIKKNNVKICKLEKNSNVFNVLKKYSTTFGCETNILVISKILGLKTYNVYLKNPKMRSLPKRYFDEYLKI